MLKLFKYEFRKTLFFKLIIIVLSALLEGLFLYGLYGDKENLWEIGAILLFVLAIGTILLLGVQSILSLHKDMNTKQAYMLFMTPHSCYAILGAKVLECMLSIALGGAYFAFLGGLDISLVIQKYNGIEEVLDFIRTFLTSVLTEIEDISVPIVLAVILQLLASWGLTVCSAFFAVTVSSAFLRGKKGNLIISFILFIAITVVMNQALNLLPALEGTVASELLHTAGNLALSAILYAGNAFVMEKYLSV